MSHHRICYIALTALTLTLAACGKPLPPEEIIRVKKLCDDAGMQVILGFNGWSNEVTTATCWPKETK